MHLIPTWALCHTEQKYINSECRSTPVFFAREVPTHPSAQLSEPDMQEYPEHPTDIHHRLPHNLVSEPQFHATHSTTHSQSIYQPSLYWSMMHYRSRLLQGQPSKPIPLHPSTPFVVFSIIKEFLKGNSRLWSNKDYSPPGC